MAILTVREKCRNFAPRMKKCMHILLSVLLSMTILFIGSGINIMRCAHTGTVKVMTAIGVNRMDMGNMNCSMTSSCMTTTHVELSPTVAAQQVNTDFHVLQPILAVLPDLVLEWQYSTAFKAIVQPIRMVWKSPPREYLAFIRILLI